MTFRISRRRKSNRESGLTGISRSSADGDLDAATDDMLLRERQTLSKGRIQRMKIMSAIVGNSVPSRKKLFTTIQTECDYKLYSITVHNMTIPCAKVFNPAILEKNSEIWSQIAHVQRFELEDPEGYLSTIPKHYATIMKHLEAFSITWTRVKSLPIELFREKLKTLYLQRNQLKTLDGIEKAVDLSTLDVSSNLLTELPRTLGLLQNLTTLSISGNAIGELPENFGALNQLRVFDCSSNRLDCLPHSICNLIELQCLDVSNNNLTILPESLSDLPKLEDIRARANQLEQLPHRFGQLSSLTSLILRKNKFTEIPKQLSTLSKLQNLNIRDNMIHSFQYAIPSLNTLILDSNELQEFTDGLLNCANLHTLTLENNKITSIPVSIKKLKNLRVLNLSGNNIESVPEDIGQLEHLRHLNLCRTQIQTLPNAILTMANLAKADISDCPQLQDYLRLAHKEGGLAKVKSEMAQAKNQNTFSVETAPPDDTAGDTTLVIPRRENENALQACKHQTIMFSNSPDVSSLAEKHPQLSLSTLQANDAFSTDMANETPSEELSRQESPEEDDCSSGISTDCLIEESSVNSKKKKEPPPVLPKTNKPPTDSKPSEDIPNSPETVHSGVVLRRNRKTSQAEDTRQSHL